MVLNRTVRIFAKQFACTRRRKLPCRSAIRRVVRTRLLGIGVALRAVVY
jgi:hypothetical protein